MLSRNIDVKRVQGYSCIPGGDFKDGRAATWKISGSGFFVGESNKKGRENHEKKYWIVVISLTVCFLAASTVSYGFDEKQLQSLKKTNNCKKCDLSGANSSNLDLTYVDLSGANLSGADLQIRLCKAQTCRGKPSGCEFHGGKSLSRQILKAQMLRKPILQKHISTRLLGQTGKGVP